MHINPYLSFDGNCAEALRHYAEVFGAELVLMPFRGSPMEAHCRPDQLDRIMHGRITAGTTVLMASDVPAEQHQPMQGVSISINVDSAEKAERIWAALSPEAKITMPLAETFWATRFGMLTDRFGTAWMFNCEKPMG